MLVSKRFRAETVITAPPPRQLEPTRGHVREMHSGQPVTHDVGGAVVGMALCGALLIDDLAPDIAAGDFDQCSACLDLLEEIRRATGDPRPTQDPGN